MNPVFKPTLVQEVEGEFEGETKSVIPKEGEIRIIANRNAECHYYYIGLDQCRHKLLKTAGDPSHRFHEFGFLPCKRLVDAHYRCMTAEQYGNSLEDVPDSGKEAANQFIDCAYKKLAPMSFCRRYFDDIVRQLYRSDNKMPDHY